MIRSHSQIRIIREEFHESMHVVMVPSRHVFCNDMPDAPILGRLLNHTALPSAASCCFAKTKIHAGDDASDSLIGVRRGLEMREVKDSLLAAARRTMRPTSTQLPATPLPRDKRDLH
jgi:hypothetical protein